MKSWQILAVILVAGIALVAALFVLTPQPDAESTAEVFTLNLTASRYEYAPGSDVPINVTQGSRVVLYVTSADVTHGLAIAEYGISEQIPPGETVKIEFVAKKAGTFTIFCDVFCGTGHPEHKGTLHVAA